MMLLAPPSINQKALEYEFTQVVIERTKNKVEKKRYYLTQIRSRAFIVHKVEILESSL